MKFANKLRAERLRAGRTQRELAAAIGTVTQYVSNIERGISLMSSDKMLKAARYLKVDVRKFVNAMVDDYRDELLRGIE